MLMSTASVRTSLSFQLMLTAAKFTRKVKGIEDEHAGEPFGEFFEDIISYTLATILSSMTALESYVNEIYTDRTTYFPGYHQQLIDDIWQITERRSALEKCQFALSLKDKGKFDTSAKFYQDTSDLVKLRNALVHYKPEWSHEEGEHKKLMKRLRGKFRFSPYYQNPTSAFPNSLMGYECARWSLTTVINFIDKFSELADIPNLHNNLRPRLTV
jgi:hypothetical protein